MKKLEILTIALLLVLITSCSKDTIYGSGELTSEFREVESFINVQNEGEFEVNIIQGLSQSLEVIADDNIIQMVKTRVDNNELRFYLDDNKMYKDVQIKVNITVLDLGRLENIGVGNVTIKNIEKNNTLYLINDGSGEIKIEGTASKLDVQNEGPGDVLAFDFIVNDCEVRIEGSGSVELNCTENLNIEIEGVGNVYYKGNPVITTTISGAGRVIDAN